MMREFAYTSAMKHLLLIALCSVGYAGPILTAQLTVRENSAPSRQAFLYFSDGSNSVGVDLFRTGQFPGQIAPPGFPGCPTGCGFAPDGSLSAFFPVFPSGSNFNLIVLNGVTVEFSNWSAYSLGFDIDPQNLMVELRQISTGQCVFCARAPIQTSSFTASFGDSQSPPDYRYTYIASGEIVPEPGSWALSLIGLMGLGARLAHRRGTQAEIDA
jgi:hypothetical protein